MNVALILRLDVFKRSTDVLLLGPASDVSFLVPDVRLGHKPPITVKPGDFRLPWEADVYECTP